MIFIIISIFTFLMLQFFKNHFLKYENVIRLILIVGAIFIEIFNFGFKIFILKNNFLISLPIYWCAVSNIIQILGLIKKNQLLLRISAFMIIGPLFSLLFIPQIAGFSKILYLFSHSFIIISTLYGIFNYLKKYDFSDTLKTINFTFIYFVIFEGLYSYVMFLLFKFENAIFKILFIFNNYYYNLYFLIIGGYLFLLFINLFVLDFIIKYLISDSYFKKNIWISFNIYKYLKN